MYILLILTIIFSCSQANQLYRLQLYSQQRGASCLDGSPPGLYILEGTTNKDKFLLFFNGGGYCIGASVNQTLQACYKRSFGELGSTKQVPKQLDGSGFGVFSPNKQQNPNFYDWTKVYIIYCDGSQYLGNRDQPIQYKDRNLYFRGAKNVYQTFNYLDQKYDFYNKDTILITGISAGGMATFQWSNYVYDHTKTSKVLSMPDSGLFLTDYESPLVGQKVLRLYAENLFKIIYDFDYVPQNIQKCLKKSNLDIVDCVNAGNYAEYLKAPTFIIQSPYDQYSIDNILVVKCLTSKTPHSMQNCNDTVRQAIQGYRQATISTLNLFKQKTKNVGMWGPSCIQHGFQAYPCLTSKDYQVSGVTLNEAIRMFLQKPESPPWLIDQIPWPQNKGCNGIINVKMQQSE